MNQNLLSKEWENSQLNVAINCLTYGINCLIFDRSTNKITKCLLTMHEQYINILHVIIEGKASFLFELQNIKNISDQDIYIKQTLKSMNYEHFFVVYTSTLESYVIVMHSQNELNVLWEGLQFFIFQANNFYSRISLMDPFKAQTAMLFMDADADGSKLLDIQEVVAIFNKLRINKNRPQIEESIVQINTDLYEKQNLKKPKGFTLNMLTPLGFQYILQYYSLKAALAPLFTQFCPIFKFKHKKFKKTIIDILKSQTKPLMSAIQFKQFQQKYLKNNISQEQCYDLIRTFPVYDGQGKQIPEQIEFLSFHNFCNFVFSPNNSVIDPSKMKIYQDMTLPLTQYFIYSSSNTYVSGSSVQADSQLQMYQFSLKKGCRCLQLDIHQQKQQIVVKHVLSKKSLLLVDVLKTIKNVCFSFNPFPLILSLQFNFLPYASDKVAQIFKSQLGELLFIVRKKNSKQDQNLPSPLQLKNRIILQLVGNYKRNKQQESGLLKLITLMPTKLDFERKGQTCWDTCQIYTKEIVKYQQVEDKNLTDYCRKIMVRTSPAQTIGQIQNYDPLPMFRNGVQMICLNIQKEDRYHYFVHSKFLQNGGEGCGYILKPNWMRSNCLQSLYASSFTKQLYVLKIKIYSGQKYILSDTKNSKFILEVYLKGTKIEEQKNKKFCSEPKTEGFYSDFEMQCQFSIYCPDLATLVLCVIDDKQKILAYRALPVNLIREGVRTVGMLGPGMELNMNSCLLIQTDCVQQKKRRRLSSVLQ